MRRIAASQYSAILPTFDELIRRTARLHGKSTLKKTEGILARAATLEPDAEKDIDKFLAKIVKVAQQHYPVQPGSTQGAGWGGGLVLAFPLLKAAKRYARVVLSDLPAPSERMPFSAGRSGFLKGE